MWPIHRRREKGPRSMRRSFVTPEGVDLKLELGGAGARAGAFALDFFAMVVVLIVATIIIALLAFAAKAEILIILWLVGFFLLRNFWFTLFEMGGRGATPGKRLMGLRVVARDGARLTGGAVLARNAMREIEVILPLSFLGAQAAEGLADTFLPLFALIWSAISFFSPRFTRDRVGAGDFVAGTWVVRTVRATLGENLAAVAARRQRRRFTDAAL